MKKVLWICGLPNEVRQKGWNQTLSPVKTAAWSWILGHLPPVGVELHILCPVVGLVRPQIEFEFKGAAWHCFRRDQHKYVFRHPFRYVRYLVSLWLFVRRLAPDVVHGWGGETGFGLMATILSPRAIVSVQGLLLFFSDLSKEFKKKMSTLMGKWTICKERLTYRRASLLVCESEASRLALKQFYGQDGIVIPQPLRASFYQEHGVTRNSWPTFLFVGTLAGRKGAVDVVKAFSSIRDKRVKLVMIGEGGSEPEIRDLIREKHLEERVEMLGNCTEETVVLNMRRAHFFSLPTYADTGPNALKEALACGLFPICYDNSGPHEYLTRYCGYLSPTGDIGAYSQAMRNAVDNIGTCVAKGSHSAQLIRKELSRDYVWNQLRRVYEGEC